MCLILQQWIIVDSKVYDITRFKDLHPGGASVFLDDGVGSLPRYLYIYETFFLISWLAGQDATEAFYGLHKHEIIVKPQYARLQIGVIEGEKPVIHGRVPGELSKVPYAEPTWLVAGFYSPYFNEVRLPFN